MFVSIIIYLFVMVQTSGNILCYYNNYLLLKITDLSIKKLRLITSQSIQLMNFKFYYEESLLRQCFFRQQRNNNQYGYTNTGKTELFMEIKKLPDLSQAGKS